GNLPAPGGSFEQARDLPVVVALEVIEGYGLPHVVIDNVAASRRAVEHLIGLGHRRIAHIAGPVPEIMSVRRVQGYRDAMQAAGLPVRPDYEQVGDYLLRSGERLCHALFDLADPPTAIFCANDEMAFGA